MKKGILLFILTAFGMNVSAKEKNVWEYSDAKLEKVFIIEASGKTNELVRIYKDGSFEHLNFILKSDGREEVQRSVGHYEINRLKITFSSLESKKFTGKFRCGTFYYNGKLYQRLFDLKFRKKQELYPLSRDKKYFKPFFMCLNSDVVVCNTEAFEQLDLKRLIDYILLGKKTQKEKVMAIIQLIIGSVEYDYDGCYKDTYANKQNDAKSILAGKNRLAVCAGYAFTMNALCEIAGIKATVINGNSKQSFSDLMHLGGYHAWNRIEVDGKTKLYDITWADDGETIDKRWLDVDPLVMIGSHFPDKSEDQLLALPITQEQFINTAVTKPLVASAKGVTFSISARQFSGTNYTLVIPGKHTINVSIVPADMFQTVYAKELGNRSRSYSPKLIGSSKFRGDSTFFSMPLNENINALEIEIDGQLEIKTVVFKGNQNDLMNYFISKVDKHYCDSYIKGIIAAIQLNDVKTLKELVGADNKQFFDKKGNLKLNKNISHACADWTEDLTSLTNTIHMSMVLLSNGTYETTKQPELHIDIPNKLKFVLDYDGTCYSLKKIEEL